MNNRDCIYKSTNFTLALIVREKVVEECIEYGRNVEDYVRNNNELTDSKLTKLCQPLVDKITTATEKRIQDEIDEEKARQKDCDTQNYIVDENAEKLAYMSNKTSLEYITEKGESICIKNIKDTFTGYTRNDSIKVSVKRPRKDIDEFSQEDDARIYDSDDEIWEPLY